jgi:hypothetical protein
LWQVVEVLAAEVVDLDGKVKFPRGEVVYSGPRQGAIEIVAARAPAGTPIIYGTATAGDGGTATAGYRGTATAGDGGTATAGYRGTATAGDGGRISIAWWDEKRQLMRTASAEMALDEQDTEGLRLGVRYRIDVVDGIPRFVVADGAP